MNDSNLKIFLRRVEENEKRIAYLLKRREYFTYKLYSIPGISYEEKGSFQKDPYHNPWIKWLDLIDEIDREIDTLKKESRLYEAFKGLLTPLETRVLEECLYLHKPFAVFAKEKNISRQRVYDVVKQIERKWDVMR